MFISVQLSANAPVQLSVPPSAGFCVASASSSAVTSSRAFMTCANTQTSGSNPPVISIYSPTRLHAVQECQNCRENPGPFPNSELALNPLAALLTWASVPSIHKVAVCILISRPPPPPPPARAEPSPPAAAATETVTASVAWSCNCTMRVVSVGHCKPCMAEI